MSPAPRTRSRSGGSDKSKEQEEEQKAQADRQAEKEKEKADKEAEKESQREAKAREKAEAEEKARQAKIDSGDLVVVGDVEFEKGTKETKVSGQVADLIDFYQQKEDPVIFADACDELDIKYPEDLVPAMHALEQVGILERYDAKKTGNGGGNRRSAAYQWVGEVPESS
jgi:hypothetical protein